MVNAYLALRCLAQSLMIEQGRSLSLPDYYSYLPHLIPHPFMGLGKFIACRIHKGRWQKSYLVLHLSWFNVSDSQLWPLYVDEPAPYCHAILPCLAKAAPRASHHQGIYSVGLNASLSTSSSLLLSLAVYIRSTGTAFTYYMTLSSPTSLASMVFPSSPVGTPLVALLVSTPLLFSARFSQVQDYFPLVVGWLFSMTVILLSFVNSMFGDVSST